MTGVLERQMIDGEIEAATETASELQALWEHAVVKPSIPLSLMNSTVSDVSPLANLTHLEYLYLTDTNVSDVSPLVNLTGLEYLDLRRTQVKDVSMLSHIGGLEIKMPYGVPDNRTGREG